MKRILTISLAAAALALVLSTCTKATSNPTTIDECLSNFINAINSTDRSTVYQNLDSTAAMYNVAKTASFWDTIFLKADIPFSLSGQSTVGSYVIATITSTYSGSEPIQFYMTEDSDKNAVIKGISLNGDIVFD